MYNDYIKIINIYVKCTTFLIKKRTSPPRTPSIPQSLRDLFRFARQMQTAMGSHIPHASGRILAERFISYTSFPFSNLVIKEVIGPGVSLSRDRA